MNSELISKTTVYEILNVSKSGFDKLGLQPFKEVKNPHGGSVPMQLFERSKIEAMRGTPEVLAASKKQRKPKDWNSIFLKEYKSAAAAIPEGCKMLFNLNRYAKYPSCSDLHKKEIYSLKNQFIEFLYNAGFCQSAYLHQLTLPAKRCLSCDGTGQYQFTKICNTCDGDGVDYNGATCYNCDGTGFYQRIGEHCHRCNGTGEYLPEKNLEFVVFEIEAQKKYVWHQPRETVTFQVDLMQNVTPMNETEIKPLEMSKSNFSKAKNLLRWILANH